jgi:hypothetical protein
MGVWLPGKVGFRYEKEECQLLGGQTQQMTLLCLVWKGDLFSAWKGNDFYLAGLAVCVPCVPSKP